MIADVVWPVDALVLATSSVVIAMTDNARAPTPSARLRPGTTQRVAGRDGGWVKVAVFMADAPFG
jgi:hypothetical protein